MKNLDIHEILGLINKEDILQTVDHNIIQNIYVFENVESFSSYNGENIPEESGPNGIFSILVK
jgi:hypothetical protein